MGKNAEKPLKPSYKCCKCGCNFLTERQDCVGCSSKGTVRTLIGDKPTCEGILQNTDALAQRFREILWEYEPRLLRSSVVYFLLKAVKENNENNE